MCSKNDIFDCQFLAIFKLNFAIVMPQILDYPTTDLQVRLLTYILTKIMNRFVVLVESGISTLISHTNIDKYKIRLGNT